MFFFEMGRILNELTISKHVFGIDMNKNTRNIAPVIMLPIYFICDILRSYFILTRNFNKRSSVKPHRKRGKKWKIKRLVFETYNLLSVLTLSLIDTN